VQLDLHQCLASFSSLKLNPANTELSEMTLDMTVDFVMSILQPALYQWYDHTVLNRGLNAFFERIRKIAHDIDNDVAWWTQKLLANAFKYYKDTSAKYLPDIGIASSSYFPV
jgi:hypothetical protein